MRRSFVVVFLVVASCAMAFAQTAVQQLGAEATMQDSSVHTDENSPVFSAADWNALASLSGEDYCKRFISLLSDESSRSELQPNALAECLWFKCFIRPFVATDEDFSPLNEMIDVFLEEMNTGSVVPHEHSDAIYSMFGWLSECGLFFMEPAEIPTLQIFSAGHLFSPPSEEQCAVKMYRAMASLERLLAMSPAVDVPAGVEESGAVSQTENTEAVAPSFDVVSVLSNPPLLFVISRVEEAKPLCRTLVEAAATLPPESLPAVCRCRELLERGRLMGVKYGFILEDVLPGFSAEVVRSFSRGTDVPSDGAFMMYCIPDADLERLVADLSCVVSFVPFYFNRLTELSRRSGVEPAGDGGGIL